MRVIRVARAADLPALDALYRQCRREAPWVAPARREDADFARDSAGEIVLAEFIEMPAGSTPCGLLSFEPDSGFIHHLYVAAAQRGQGTGTRLLAALLGRLPLPWQLKCVRANVAALHFYARSGWVEHEVIDDDGGTGEGPHVLLELRARPQWLEWPDVPS